MDKLHLRDKNFIWALSENYGLNLDEFLFFNDLDEYTKFNFSYAMSLGDSELLIEYLNYLSDIDKHQTFNSLFLIGLNCFIFNKIKRIRPVINDIKNEHFTNLYKHYKNAKRDDLVKEVKYSLAMRCFNQVPKTTKSVLKLVNTLTSFHSFTNIVQLIEAFEALLDESFFFSDAIDRNKRKDGKSKFNPKSKSKKKYESENVLDEYYGLIGSAEFTSDLDLDGIKRDDDDKLIIKKRDEDNQTDKYVLATNLFGENILKSENIKSIEKEICYGNHKNSKIIISKGEYTDNLESNFRKRQLEESNAENKDYYDYLKNVFQRNERDIEKQIKTALIKDLDYTINRTYQGNIVASNIYRSEYVNDNKIFNKKVRFENTDISVDILIDSSASQLARKSRIAAWSYTITNALVKASIPTRVMGFSNLENYLGLTIYRSYNDPIEKNKDLFNFLPAGSNRDGLAFRLVNKLIQNSQAKQKVLIYLTDGKPFDIRTRVDNKQFSDEIQYKDKLAEIDTSIEFRKLEANDVYPLSIYTGNDEELETMVKIYGNNFAYIKDLNRFSSIITQYIKRIIEN